MPGAQGLLAFIERIDAVSRSNAIRRSVRAASTPDPPRCPPEPPRRGPAAAAAGRPEDWTDGEPLRRYPVADFAAFEQARGRAPAVLDVRRHAEWRFSRIEGALHIPPQELPGRLGELPGARIWVHCQSG